MAVKSGATSKLDPEVITSRLEIMQHFLDSVVEHPELVVSQALLEFLRSKDDDFKKYKKEFDKVSNPNAVIATSGINKKLFYLKNPIKVDHVITSTGKTDCRINKYLSTFGLSFKTYLKEVVPHHDKFTILSKQLISTVSQVKLLLDKMGESISQIHGATVKFGDAVSKDELPRWDSMEKIYSQLESILKNNGRRV